MRTTVSRQIKPHGELDKIRKRKGLVLFQLNFDGGLDSDTEHPFSCIQEGGRARSMAGGISYYLRPRAKRRQRLHKEAARLHTKLYEEKESWQDRRVL